MVRKNTRPASPPVLVTDELLADARARAEAAAGQLRDAEQADPGGSWEADYAAAVAATRATALRVEGLERLRAAQVERSGQRAMAVSGAALPEIAAQLGASRDRVADAAAEHLQALAGLAAATGAHNALLAQSRALLAELGLRVRDDLVAEGDEHSEGVLDGKGLRAGGIDWTPVPAAGVVSHALRQVLDTAPGFRGPFAATKYAWRAHEVERRPDGLTVPTLADAGLPVPIPPAAVPVERMSVGDHLPPGQVAPAGGHYPVSA